MYTRFDLVDFHLCIEPFFSYDYSVPVGAELAVVLAALHRQQFATCYTGDMRKKTFQLVFEPDLEGGYTVTVPALPGCITYGAEMEEARKMAREAIELYLEDLAASNEKIPQTDTTLFGAVEVAVK